ncbi:MAG: DUF2157 domain-containing protein [Synechococcaceae cyanobacterium SM2_3_1]|nr:DUF2157 domain-containing protein [Synechococcaceae cyanobacterium SM2_3_1]
MADDRFRRQLAQILDTWVLEGLIDSPQRENLRQYYDLEDLHSSASNRFATVLLSIGAVLIGLGIISFIAANWTLIPRSLRALISLGLMIGLQVQGFRLWRVGHKPRLGSVFLLVGELAMGAAIGLMAQWVQVSGPPSGLFMAWSLGVLGMAYGIRHTPSAILGILLWMIGYFTNIAYAGAEIWLYSPAVGPWFMVLLLLPLAYWCRSRWLIACVGICWLSSMPILAWGIWQTVEGSYRVQDQVQIYALGLTSLLGILCLWYWSLWHQRMLPWFRLQLRLSPPPQSKEEDAGLEFHPTGQFLALLSLLGILFVWGFQGIYNPFVNPAEKTLIWKNLLMLDPNRLTIIALLILVIVLAVNHFRCFQLQSLNMMTTDIMVGISALCLSLALSLGHLFGLVLVLINLAYFALAAAISWQGLHQGQRWRFWLGLLALTLQILTRFFEYETGLLIRSVVLICCGTGVILAGLRFERERTLSRAQS